MSSRRWVVNASPLILLGKIGRLDLLESLTASLAVPQSVIREIGAGGESDATAVATAAWAQARAVADILLPPSAVQWERRGIAGLLTPRIRSRPGRGTVSGRQLAPTGRGGSGRRAPTDATRTTGPGKEQP